MNDGRISGNTAASSGGGVYVGYYGTFTKQSKGTIYGSDTGDMLKNTAGNGNGHAVYIHASPVKKRNTTAGVGVTLDSTKSGSDGGWE
jgi:predicted outer membrane repeat protein